MAIGQAGAQGGRTGFISLMVEAGAALVALGGKDLHRTPVRAEPAHGDAADWAAVLQETICIGGETFDGRGGASFDGRDKLVFQFRGELCPLNLDVGGVTVERVLGDVPDIEQFAFAHAYPEDERHREEGDDGWNGRPYRGHALQAQTRAPGVEQKRGAEYQEAAATHHRGRC